jgi:hypothetical protein
MVWIKILRFWAFHPISVRSMRRGGIDVYTDFATLLIAKNESTAKEDFV